MVKFTSPVCVASNNKRPFELPTKAQRDDLIRQGKTNLYLAAFENNQLGQGSYFNVVLSDGSKT